MDALCKSAIAWKYHRRWFSFLTRS